MRQKPTRIFANQPIPTCSGFTCMGCLKRPRGPSGTCHSKAKVPRASIPLNAATSESAHISGIQFLLVLSHSWCHVFFSKGPFVLLELGLFICSYNKQEMYLGCPTTTLQSPGNVQDGASAEKKLVEKVLTRGKPSACQNWSNQFSEFFVGERKTISVGDVFQTSS